MESSRNLESAPSRRLPRTYTLNAFSDVRDPEVVPSSLAVIAPILRVANEIEDSAPRVAHLCRFYAFEKAHRLDPSSSGRGVRQFKTALLHKLERDEETTQHQRKARNDAREMQNYYQEFYDKYVRSLENAGDNVDRAQLARTYQTAAVLFDVLTAVNQTDEGEPKEQLAPEIMLAGKDIGAKVEIYVPFNILPLDPAGSKQAIMLLPEVKAAVGALKNTRGLPVEAEMREELKQKQTEFDLLDWLQFTYGFQKDNVSNQREHLILLLANVHIRHSSKLSTSDKLSDTAMDEVMRKLFENYKIWCKFLGRPENLVLPTIQPDMQQRKILYMCLYLLIWGEAANLRFMPESLCYIFHHMARELNGIVTGEVSPATGENVKHAYDGKGDSFLRNIVTPLYQVIGKEVSCNKNGTARHSAWRNYDDLNEFFWSTECFRLDWPMRTNKSFFRGPNEKRDSGGKWIGKINFVEVRSFWHVFRSFDRMWSFYILALQAMVIVAWNGTGPITDAFRRPVLMKVLTIFITSAILRFIQAIVDIVLSFQARQSMKATDRLRYILKVVVALAWVIILPVCYAHTWGKSIQWFTFINKWVGNSFGSSVYTVAILMYLAPDGLAAMMFLFPFVRRHIEQSDGLIFRFLLWWAQPPLYIGRGMHDNFIALLKYTSFWVSLLLCKMMFSYYVEVKPLISPTKEIFEAPASYQWHELFPNAKYNVGAVVALWSPIIMVYFMDTQIWYAVWSTLYGGGTGAFSRLGEIRSMAILRTRFRVLPAAINDNLVPSNADEEPRRRGFFSPRTYKALDESYKPSNEVETKSLEQGNHTDEQSDVTSKVGKLMNPLEQVTHGNGKVDVMPDHEKNNVKDRHESRVKIAKFSQLWNMIIETLHNEDYIHKKEKELLLMPFPADPKLTYLQWPPFLLANKIALALETAKDFVGHDDEAEFRQRFENDVYLHCAVTECYDLLKFILRHIMNDQRESLEIEKLITAVENAITNGILVRLRMDGLPLLYAKIVELVKILEERDAIKDDVTYLLQDIHEVFLNDVIKDAEDHEVKPTPDSSHGGPVEKMVKNRPPQLFAGSKISYPPDLENTILIQKIKRLHLLLTIEESAMDVPANLDARRRITFFTNSVFMEMPSAPKIRNMLSFSVLTPYFDEEIIYAQKGLEEENEDGVSILFYLQRIYPDEWKNFRERKDCPAEDFWDLDDMSDSVRKWASYRAQTLTRTVRGMMYYRKAIELQAFFDMANDDEILDGYEKCVNVSDNNQHSYYANIQAIADMKFTYVATCQKYGLHKRTGDRRAADVLQLLKEYPALRVAYIDEVEVNKEKEYYSVLVKGVKNSDTDQEIYRIKLPGQPILGEGKPENQNHAIIFTRGEALQAIDMNQDNYLEESLKMRNLLQQFHEKLDGHDYPSILGMREHIFTGSVSSLAGFMSNQESSFVTIGQRVLANPLKVRFHYGHPDVFDRLFHITRGGISKASKVVNLSEDIFAGFNTTLRRGNVTHHEYIQVGKGRDVGLNQISMFEAKIANGNGEQTMSRDVYRLGHRLDFFRMLSVYFTTIGFYSSTLIVVLSVYVFLYGRIYLSLSGLEASLVRFAGLSDNKPLQLALASQASVQIGLLMALPMVMELGLERGFRKAMGEFIVMQLQLASVFFTFSMGTKVHFYGRTLLHGGAKYRPTGRGFVVFHEKFAENYRIYSRSHFTKGLELLMLLIVYDIYGVTVEKTVPYLLITASLWFLVGTWLFAPFLFNPSGFEWQKIVDDWDDWNKWMNNRGGIGVQAAKSWESWWEEEREHLSTSGHRGQLIEIILSARFLLYQYGIVYHLNIARRNKSILVYGLSWLVMLAVLVTLKIVSAGRRKFHADCQLFFRLLKIGLLVAVIALLAVFFVFRNLTIGDIFVGCFAFLPSGWALIQIAQTCKPAFKKIGFWGSIKGLARAYDYLMGFILFAPVAVLAWFPFISEFQTRLLFNQAFSRGLQISRILAGRKEKKTN